MPNLIIKFKLQISKFYNTLALLKDSLLCYSRETCPRPDRGTGIQYLKGLELDSRWSLSRTLLRGRNDRPILRHCFMIFQKAKLIQNFQLIQNYRSTSKVIFTLLE